MAGPLEVKLMNTYKCTDSQAHKIVKDLKRTLGIPAHIEHTPELDAACMKRGKEKFVLMRRVLTREHDIDYVVALELVEKSCRKLNLFTSELEYAECGEGAFWSEELEAECLILHKELYNGENRKATLKRELLTSIQTARQANQKRTVLENLEKLVRTKSGTLDEFSSITAMGKGKDDTTPGLMDSPGAAPRTKTRNFVYRPASPYQDRASKKKLAAAAAAASTDGAATDSQETTSPQRKMKKSSSKKQLAAADAANSNDTSERSVGKPKKKSSPSKLPEVDLDESERSSSKNSVGGGGRAKGKKKAESLRALLQEYEHAEISERGSGGGLPAPFSPRKKKSSSGVVTVEHDFDESERSEADFVTTTTTPSLTTPRKPKKSTVSKESTLTPKTAKKKVETTANVNGESSSSSLLATPSSSPRKLKKASGSTVATAKKDDVKADDSERCGSVSSRTKTTKTGTAGATAATTTVTPPDTPSGGLVRKMVQSMQQQQKSTSQ